MVPNHSNNPYINNLSLLQLLFQKKLELQLFNKTSLSFATTYLDTRVEHLSKKSNSLFCNHTPSRYGEILYYNLFKKRLAFNTICDSWCLSVSVMQWDTVQNFYIHPSEKSIRMGVVLCKI